MLRVLECVWVGLDGGSESILILGSSVDCGCDFVWAEGGGCDGGGRMEVGGSKTTCGGFLGSGLGAFSGFSTASVFWVVRSEMGVSLGFIFLL